MQRKTYKKKLYASIILLIISTNTIQSYTVIGKNIDRRDPLRYSKIDPFLYYADYVATDIHKELCREGIQLQEDVFILAFRGFSKLSAAGRLNSDSILTIIDFSRSSREKRLFVIDLKKKKTLFNTLVAHGKNTGAEYARNFSNKINSNQSSLGFYITRSTYIGSNGYSLTLDGIEKEVNDKANSRAIVMHAAEYANESMIKIKGYLGRSLGCPALPTYITKSVIDKIKNGSCIFMYYPDLNYLCRSEILNE